MGLTIKTILYILGGIIVGIENGMTNTKKALIGLTQKFINVLDELYESGNISAEQYEDMVKVKREFLRNAQV